MASKRHQRFHLSFNGQRTTISVDVELANLMKLHLGVNPDSLESHRVLRHWLLDNILSIVGDQPGLKNASTWARRCIIREITKPDLMRRYSNWYVTKGQ